MRRALQFAAPHQKEVLAIMGFTLVLSAVGAAEPLVLKFVFDGLGTTGVDRVLLIGVAALLLLTLVREGVSSVTNWLTWQTRLGIHFTLLEATVGRLHSMPLRMQRSEGVGAIITRLDRSIQGFINAVTQILFQILPAVVYLVLSIVVMVQL